MIDKNISFTKLIDGELVIIENVPAQVCVETGEEFFSPEVVRKLQKIIKSRPKPARTIKTSVYNLS